MRVHARNSLREQGAEGRPRLDPRVPVLRVLVLGPWNVAQVIRTGELCRRSQIGIAQIVAGKPVPRAGQPSDKAKCERMLARATLTASMSGPPRLPGSRDSGG